MIKDIIQMKKTQKIERLNGIGVPEKYCADLQKKRFG